MEKGAPGAKTYDDGAPGAKTYDDGAPVPDHG